MNDMPIPPVSDTALPVPGAKPSKLGLAAFIVSLVGLLIFCLAVAVSFIYGASLGVSNPAAARNPVQAIDLSSPFMVISAVLSWCGPIVNFIGLVMGVVALFQKDTKKTFAILAVVISALVVIVFCGLTIFGTLAQLASF
ncbi:MAG: hypothetical protein ABWK53_00190 [Anaerolineales bacterium]